MPLPEQLHEAIVFEQRVLSATQLPDVQTSQLPVQSEFASVHVPKEPATLQRLQLPVHRVLQQYPSTQNSEAQSIEAVHECPPAKGACIAAQLPGGK